jgi:hypothetical protein
VSIDVQNELATASIRAFHDADSVKGVVVPTVLLEVVSGSASDVDIDSLSYFIINVL